MNKSSFGFAGVLLRFYLDREKCAFSKIAFQVRSKVHFVRLIFRSRGKFTLVILEFVQFSFLLFFCARIQLKKGPRPAGPKAQPAGRLPSQRARQAQRQAAASLALGRVPEGLQAGQPPLSLFCFPSFACPLPQVIPPTYINTPQTPPSPHINPKPLSSLASPAAAALQPPPPPPYSRRRRRSPEPRRGCPAPRLFFSPRFSFSSKPFRFFLNRSGFLSFFVSVFFSENPRSVFVLLSDRSSQRT